jgi:hypothetical protein
MKRRNVIYNWTYYEAIFRDIYLNRCLIERYIELLRQFECLKKLLSSQPPADVPVLTGELSKGQI